MADPSEFLSTLKIDLYPGRGLHLHAEGQGRHPSARRHADRFRLQHPHRSRTHLRRRQGQRPHCSSALQAALGRHRRDPHPDRPQSQPRLARHRQVFARAAEDQALAQRSSARTRHRNRPQADRKGSAQVSHFAQGIKDEELMRVASEYGLGRPDDLMAANRLRQVFCALDPRETAAGQHCRTPGEDGEEQTQADSPASCGASSAATPRPSRFADTTTCSSTARDVVIRFAAKRSSAMLRAAKAWPCIPSVSQRRESYVRTGAPHRRGVGREGTEDRRRQQRRIQSNSQSLATIAPAC